MIKRVATATLVTVLVLLGAAAAGFALAYAPGQTPRSANLPRVVTGKADTPVAVAATATTAPVLPVGPRTATQARPPAGDASKSSTPTATTNGEVREPSDDDHEVVTPPVHDSDDDEDKAGGEDKKGNEEPH